MPRAIRHESLSGYYHVMHHGNAYNAIFEDDLDRQKMLSVFFHQAEKGSMDVLAYCLMDNHFHLVLKPKGKELSNVMRSIGISYATYFNRRHRRQGHLFHDRYKSEPIEDKKKLFSVVRYIHRDPVRQLHCAKVSAYPWSSDLIYRKNDGKSILKVVPVLSALAEDEHRAVSLYSRLVENDGEKCFLDVNQQPLSESEIKAMVRNELNNSELMIVRNSDSEKAMAQLVKNLNKKYRFSYHKIAQILCISHCAVEYLAGQDRE